MDSKLKDQFDTMKDAFGQLRLSELGKLLRLSGYDPTENELKNYVTYLDSGRTGKVDWPSLSKYIPSIRQPFTAEELREAFAYFDKNKDEKISLNEFKAILTSQGDKMSYDEVEEIFQELDQDGSGFLDYKEFANKLATRQQKAN